MSCWEYFLPNADPALGLSLQTEIPRFPQTASRDKPQRPEAGSADSNLVPIQEARLKISEGIILAEDAYRTNAIDKHLADLALTSNLSNYHHARIEAISAGNNFLKGDYTKAALQYLTAARMEAYVKD